MSREVERDVTESQHPQQPRRIEDVRKLRQALLDFLGDEHADWEALSRELKRLAAAASARPGTQPLRKIAAGPSESSLDPEETREAWAQLADFLEHGDPARGVPENVRKLLDSDAAARAAEAAFAAVMSQRDAWLNFARRADSSR